MITSTSLRHLKGPVTFCLVAVSGIAFAQGSSAIEERLRGCDAIEHPGDKLACFNSVVESLEGVPEPSVPDTPAAPVAAAPAVTPVVEPAPAAEAAPEPVVEATPKQLPDDFGLKEEKPKKEEAVPMAVLGTVVNVWEHHDRRFTVELDNGQRWRETEGTRIGIPKIGDTVTITEGKIGGFRAKFGRISRTAWVRRTR